MKSTDAAPGARALRRPSLSVCILGMFEDDLVSAHRNGQMAIGVSPVLLTVDPDFGPRQRVQAQLAGGLYVDRTFFAGLDFDRLVEV